MKNFKRLTCLVLALCVTLSTVDHAFAATKITAGSSQEEPTVIGKVGTYTVPYDESDAMPGYIQFAPTEAGEYKITIFNNVAKDEKKIRKEDEILYYNEFATMNADYQISSWLDMEISAEIGDKYYDFTDHKHDHDFVNARAALLTLWTADAKTGFHRLEDYTKYVKKGNYTKAGFKKFKDATKDSVLQIDKTLTMSSGDVFNVHTWNTIGVGTYQIKITKK